MQQSKQLMNTKKSIDLLNKGVADELQAVHQYMYWHFHLDDQGFAPLSSMFRRIAIQEMVHVERLAERILFLKGDVLMVPAGPVEKITEARQICSRPRRWNKRRSASTTSSLCKPGKTPTLPRSRFLSRW